MNDILPCPYCGSTDLRIASFDCNYLYQIKTGERFNVLCTSCEASGPITFDSGDAVEAWNQRAEAQS